MKVLIIASHIYRENEKILNKTKTGLSIQIGYLVDQIKDKVNILLLTTNQIAGKTINFVDNSPIKMLRNIDSNFFRSVMDIKINKFGVKGALRETYQILELTECKKLLCQGNDWVVNVHDATDFNVNVVKFCEKKKIPCAITMHLYIEKKTGDCFPEYIDLIKNQVDIIENTMVPIIAVSEGMKRKILNDYPFIDQDRFHVIQDGLPVRKVTGVDKPQNNDDRFVFVCVGTVCERKNQMQLLHALAVIPECIRMKLKIVFCGVDSSHGSFQNEISNMGLADCVEYLGEVEHDQMNKVYCHCDATVTVSMNESFGLAIVEGFTYGKPAVYYRFIDSADELYSPEAVVMIQENSDIEIANALICCMEKKWDKQMIMNHAANYDICRMGEKYISLYQSLSAQ